MSDNVLAISGLCKSFGGLQVIDDVNALHAWPASISHFVLRHAADYSRL